MTFFTSSYHKIQAFVQTFSTLISHFKALLPHVSYLRAPLNRVMSDLAGDAAGVSLCAWVCSLSPVCQTNILKQAQASTNRLRLTRKPAVDGRHLKRHTSHSARFSHPALWNEWIPTCTAHEQTHPCTFWCHALPYFVISYKVVLRFFMFWWNNEALSEMKVAMCLWKLWWCNPHNRAVTVTLFCSPCSV